MNGSSLRCAAALCCCAALALPPASVSQVRIPLTVTDLGGHAVLVQFGYDARATRCIDTVLGEFELPPGGCGDPSICASFRDVRNDASGCLGEGLLLDLRPFGAPSDSFRLAVTGPGGVPVVVRWTIPPELGFDSLRLLDLAGGAIVNVDMLLDDSATVDLALAPELLIVGWGSEYLTGVDEAGVPASRRILANYPNPFNPSTTVAYSLPARAPVLLAVYDPLGREVARLVDRVEEAGEHAASWDAGGAASGWYACRLTAGSRRTSILLLLIR